MTLIKTSLLNAIAVVIKMLTLLGINKVLAIYVGPSGYAEIGQFQNAVQMITTFASGGINTGVTKYTAEYNESATEQHKVWSTAATIAFIGSIFISFLIILFSRDLSIFILKDESYAGVFVGLACALVFFIFNALMLAVLNGKKEIKSYVCANIVGSVFALVITSILAYVFKLYGALFALAIYQSLTFFVTVYLCRKLSWFRFGYFFGAVDKKIAVNLVKYAGMAFVSVACVPVSSIIIRDHLGVTFGWASAGYWEGMLRLSSAYMLIVATTLSVYYLPKLSELRKCTDLVVEISNGYKLVIPVTLIAALFIYTFRFEVVQILFSEDFLPMVDLFFWQLLGDVLKASSWILSYLMLSKAFYKLYIVTEISFSVLLVVLCFLLTPHFGVVGVVIAYAINYGLYWVVVAAVLGRRLYMQEEL